MSVITLAADSTTLILNGTAITNFAEGDFITLAPVNPLTAHVNSAVGGVNITKRMDHGVRDLTFRIQKYSADDVFMTQQMNSESPVVFGGSVKEAFNRDGADFTESWGLQSGSITTQPTETKNNQDGNALVEYVIRFRESKRNL